MLLASRSGDFVELSIVGYEFDVGSLDPDDEWDRNWLVVSGRVRSAADSWSFRAPCLTTWEARRFGVWLQRSIRSNPEPIEFTEPNLAFQAGPLRGSRRDVTVVLGAESAPPRSSDSERWDHGCSLTLHVATDAVAEAARAWAGEVAALPAR